MGTEATNQDEIEQENLETEVEETEVDDETEESQETEETETTEESETEGDEDDSVQVVHADDADTANTEGNDKPKGPPRRVRKLLERIDTQQTKFQQELSGKDAENQLLKMQLEQLAKAQGKEQAKKPPTLAEYGYDEGKYAQAMAEFVAETAVPSVFSKQLEQHQSHAQQEQAKLARNNALESHYQRADSLKVKDYDVAEEKAVDVLGRDLVEDIAATADDSHLLLYYLGKNPGKAEELKRTFDEKGPALGTYALGKIAAGLKTVSAGPKKPTLNPDKPVDGAGPSGVTWQQRIEKARAEAEKTGDMTPVIRLKKQAREAGVNL